MRFPRIKITLRRMMVGVAVAALLLYGYVSFVDSVRQRRMQAVRTLYLAKARGHASLVKHWRWGARRRLDAVPNCLKLARQQRLWLPVAPDPEVESLAVQWEMRAAGASAEAHLFLRRAAYEQQLEQKYLLAAERPLLPVPPDPPAPP